ncbi:MAG TPA: fibronectin type III domain-containing protein [Gaiellaceae bacterium]|nr:fibronectin type III domain-containing protein [Gaiellaceae bacterium]
MKMRLGLALVAGFLVVNLVEAGAGAQVQRRVGGQCGSPPCWTTFTINGSASLPSGVTLSLNSGSGQIQVSLQKSNQTELSPAVAVSDTIHMVLNLGAFDPVVFGTTGLISAFSETINGSSNTITIDLKPTASSWNSAGCSVISCGSDVNPVTATNDFTSVVLGFVSDLSTSGASQATKDAMRGTWFSTNAQSMTLPSFNSSTGKVSFTVAAPHFKTNGSTLNSGFFEFFAPDALVTSMGVADPTTVSNGTFTVSSSNNTSTTFSVAHQASPAGVLIQAGTNPPSLPMFSYSSPTFTVSKSTTVPGAPTDVSANASDGQATVSFSAPASNGGAAISSYTVTASPGGATASGSSSPITVSGLSNGASYTFTVAATNSVGTGSASSASGAVTPAGLPGAPSSVSAVAGDGKAVVSFATPSSNGGAAITSYTVTASPGGATTTSGTSPITISGLSNGTSYSFTVAATNSVGTGSASPVSGAVTPAGLPGVPSAVTAVASDGKAAVSFAEPASNGAAISSYTVTASPGGATASGSSGPITVSGLANCTSYTFTVTATNSVGTSGSSSASSLVVPAAASGCTAVTTSSQAYAGIAGSLTLPVPSGSALSVSWSSGTFSSTVAVSAVTEAVTASATPPALSGFIAGSVAVELNFTSGGSAVHTFAAPLEVVIPGGGSGFAPGYSTDGGVTWISIPLLSGTTLPAGQQDGYYTNASGTVHILTLHATYFGLIGDLVLQTWNPASFPVGSKSIFVYLATHRQADATVVLETHSGTALGSLKVTLPAGSTKVKLPLPTGLKAGIYLVKVNATTGPSSVQRILVLRLVGHK